MSEHSPQDDVYKLITKLQKIKKVFFYNILSISLLSVLINLKWITNIEILTDFLNIINLILLVGFSILSLTIDNFLQPKALELTRNDFFDNAFNRKFIEGESSKNYFTNDEIEYGTYKMAVNLYENCFFTFNIGETMFRKRLNPVIVLVIILLILAFWGYKNVPISIPILQAFLSIYFLGGLVRLYRFNENNCIYLDRLKSLFSDSNLRRDVDNKTPEIIKLYCDYESNKAWSLIKIDSKLFDQLNEDLSNKWNKIKEKYSIQSSKS